MTKVQIGSALCWSGTRCNRAHPCHYGSRTGRTAPGNHTPTQETTTKDIPVCYETNIHIKRASAYLKHNLVSFSNSTRAYFSFYLLWWTGSARSSWYLLRFTRTLGRELALWSACAWEAYFHQTERKLWHASYYQDARVPPRSHLAEDSLNCEYFSLLPERHPSCRFVYLFAVNLGHESMVRDC